MRTEEEIQEKIQELRKMYGICHDLTSYQYTLSKEIDVLKWVLGEE